jgi:cold shock CspA family protein/ribosome-associated translation inhibitor RaiA
METPLQIVFRDVAPFEDVLKAEIEKRAGKLEQFFPNVISCRVSVDRPHKSQRTGNLYNATVVINVPEKQIAVSREHPHHTNKEDIFVAVRHAFDEAERQLEEYSLRQYGNVKSHDIQPMGVISKLFSEDGYGFISEIGGREVYFHKNSVLDGFENLQIGTEVRFTEEQGEKGPQASTVKIMRKEHVHHRRH